MFLYNSYGIDITVITFKQESYFANKLSKSGIKILVIKGGYIKRFFHLYKICKVIRPDVFHIFNFSPGPYASVAAKLANTKVIFASTGATYLSLKINKFLYRAVDRLIDGYICNAQSGKIMLINDLKINDNKIKLIKNGIDFESMDRMHRKFQNGYDFFKKFSNKIIVGSVGNLLDDKDPMNFVNSAKLVKENFNNVIFILVGSGPLEKNVKTFIDQNQLDDCFFIFNDRNDGPSISKYFDVCVLSSKTEAFPNVLLEYMYWSKPVIATNVGDCSKVVIDNETGFIVPPMNSYLLSKKILTLVKDIDLSKKFGNMGKKRLLKNYSIKAYSDNILKIYSESIKIKE